MCIVPAGTHTVAGARKLRIHPIPDHYPTCYPRRMGDQPAVARARTESRDLRIDLWAHEWIALWRCIGEWEREITPWVTRAD